MPCKFPIHGWRSRERTEKRKRGIVYRLQQGLCDLRAVVPCGQCTDCRLDKSREWAIRCVHEAEMHEPNNCVITLTYAPENLPAYGSIKPEHAVKFMKRLRERARYTNPKSQIRSYGCAEYGEKGGRPHYHIILFNHHFEDRKQIPFKPGYYESAELTDIWGHGSTQLMDLTFESAAYVARYVMKKLTGPRKEEYGNKLPEQPVCVSRGKGIGKEWYEEWKQEIYETDTVYRNKKTGQKIGMKPPKYYDKRMEIDNPEKFKKIKKQRKRKNQKRQLVIQNEIDNGNLTNAMDGHGQRQMDYVICQDAAMKSLKRGYENGET